jgi:hypothetical protein
VSIYYNKFPAPDDAAAPQCLPGLESGASDISGALATQKVRVKAASSPLLRWAPAQGRGDTGWL